MSIHFSRQICCAYNNPIET